MAQERPSTPEKQLLDLIENPKKQDLSQKKIKRTSLTFLSFAALRGRLSFLWDTLSSGDFRKLVFDLKSLNQVLKGCIFVLVIYLIFYFTMAVVKLNEVPEFASKNPRGSTELSATGITARNVSYYLEGPRTRNIFKFGDITETAIEEMKKDEVSAPVEPEDSPAAALAKQLSLVGIGWSDDPDVMVQNLQSGKMYFLKKGQRIDGMIKVEAIFEDRVIMTYDNGQELELR